MSGRARLAGALLLPGLALSLVLTLPVVWNWPSGELYYGSKSLAGTWRSVADALLDGVNPNLVHPKWRRALDAAGPYLLGACCALGAARLALLAGGCFWRRSEHSRRLAGLGAVAASTCVAALALHWLAFRFTGLLLPLERTAIYLVPLLATLAGVAAAEQPGAAARRSRLALLLAMWALAGYFLLSLRLTYYKQWWWGAEVRQAYAVLSRYQQRLGFNCAVANWKYAAALNFYRIASGNSRWCEFKGVDFYPPGAAAYVLFEPHDGAFIAAQGLEVVCRGESGIAVAIAARVGPVRAPCVPPP